MSNALAVATATTALAQIVRSAVQSAVTGSDCLTERPPSAPGSEPRVRLFLYQVSPNAALRNLDMPQRGADGSLMQRPTAAIDLHFLLSFYGSEPELEPQRMLGAVVRDLNEKPVLMRQMILDAVASQTFLSGSDLADAPEKVKFTPVPLSLDELSKLWSVLFQTPYALSVAYRGTVILLDAEDPGQQALPVLRRGEEDRGVDAMIGAFPSLERIEIGRPGDDARAGEPLFPSAVLGSRLVLRGRNFAGDRALVRLAHPLLAAPREIDVAPAHQQATQVQVALPADEAGGPWPAGLYTAEVVVLHEGSQRASNRRAFALAPRVTGIDPNPVVRDAANAATLTITCEPAVLPQQTALLQIGNREVPAEELAAPDTELEFTIPDALPTEDALVRLRVDGVNSMPVVRSPGSPPRLVFDDAQRVTIQ